MESRAASLDRNNRVGRWQTCDRPFWRINLTARSEADNGPWHSRPTNSLANFRNPEAPASAYATLRPVATCGSGVRNAAEPDVDPGSMYLSTSPGAEVEARARKRALVEQMLLRNLSDTKKQPPETLISEDWNPPNDKGGEMVGEQPIILSAAAYACVVRYLTYEIKFLEVRFLVLAHSLS
jgi:hypothetical protein